MSVAGGGADLGGDDDVLVVSINDGERQVMRLWDSNQYSANADVS